MMNSPFQKRSQPSAPANAPISEPTDLTQNPTATPTGSTTNPIAAPDSPATNLSPNPAIAPPTEASSSADPVSSSADSNPAEAPQQGPIYPAEAVDLDKLNSILSSTHPLEDIRDLFAKQIKVDVEATVRVDTITVPGFIGVSDDFFVQDPRGNSVSGYADVANILAKEDLLICTYQGNASAHGTPIDLSYDANQPNDVSGTVNRRVEGTFEGDLDGKLVGALTVEFSGTIDLMSDYDAQTGESRPALQMKGSCKGSLSGRFDGAMQGKLESATQFDHLLVQDTIVKNEGFHATAIVPARRMNYAIDEVAETFASFNQPAGYHEGVYGGEGLIAVAQRLVFDPAITPEEATGYRHTMIAWMGLLSHVVNFADRNIDGGDPTAVVDLATLKTILSNGVRASLGDPDALSFFDESDNKLYCAEFIYIALNTPLFPFNLSGLTALLDGDAHAATAILKHQERYAAAQFNVFSALRDPYISNPQLVERNILLPKVASTLPPLDQLLSGRGKTVSGLPFPPFTISQVIRRAFHTLLPRHDVLEAPKLAKLQSRLFRAIEPMLIQQVLPATDLGSLPEEALAAVQADPRVQQVKEFIARVQVALSEATDEAELHRQFDEIVQQADALVRQSGSIVEFVPPRIYVDLGQQDGDRTIPTGWGFHLETIGAMISRSAINGAVPPVETSPDESSGEEAGQGAG